MGLAMKRPTEQDCTDKDIAARRDAAVRRALNTPPKPLKEMKAEKTARAKAKTTRPERRT